MVQVQSLNQELPHSTGVTKKKKSHREIKRETEKSKLSLRAKRRAGEESTLWGSAKQPEKGQ